MATFITVQQAIDRITLQKKRVIGEVSNPLWFVFLDALNFKAYEALYSLQPQDYITTETYAVLDDTEAYNDPTDLKSLRVPVAGYFDTNTDGTRKYPALLETAIDSQRNGYVRRGGQVFFTPKPTKDRTVLLDYIPTIDNLSALSDFLVLNSENLDSALHHLGMKYGDWNLDVATQIANDQMLARDLATMFQDVAVESQMYLI